MSPSLLIRFARRVGSIAKTSAALGTVGVLGGVGYQYNEIKKYDEARLGTSKKKVLVLPFHRMKIVEQKNDSLRDILVKATSSDEKDEALIEVEVKELVDTIHAAAEDPNISSLYASFGHGFGFKSGGFAHIEEIRNAIKVFNESRRMQDMCGEDSHNNDRNISNQDKKHSFAFADTFDNPSDSCNSEFFLASAFSQVIMQNRGDMNLFGVSLSNLFLKGALDKYGIKAHVFKHGKYKNAPNTLTEKGYTKSHLQNTKSLVESLNQTICSSIVKSRRVLDSFDDSTWKLIHNYGTMTAENAKELGLIDYMTSINPIEDLMTANKGNESLNRLREKWGSSLQLNHFQASDSLSYKEYLSLLSRRKKARNMKWRIHSILQDVAKLNGAAKSMLSILGYESPYFNVDENEYVKHNSMQTNEKIALLHITGNITDSLAREASKSIREIKNDADVKCVVLRIDSSGGSVTASERILEECKDLSQPIICSFSNYAASGGYYIATHSEKIFALPTTITGSIGVFGVKIDATDFGRQYGIEMENVTSGKHALTNNLFDPLTKAVKMNLLRNVDRVYNYFKQIVSDGRKLSLKEVEEIAQGRVWTGEQAREIGLVDELGGVDDAISYAMKKYATTGAGHVELWPQKPSFKKRVEEQIGSIFDSDEKEMMTTDLERLVINGKISRSTPMDILSLMQNKPAVMLTMDEGSAINIATGNYFKKYPDRS